MTSEGPPEYAHLEREHYELLTGSRRIASESLTPLATSAEAHRVNRPLVRGLAEHGLLSRLFPRESGGPFSRAVPSLELCLMREGLAGGCTEAETAFALQGLGSYPILQAGRDEVIDEWMPQVAAGELVASFALTEPEAGTDVASLRMEARRERDGYRLTGTKTFISNAPEADIYTVFARTTTDAGARGITAFAVPGDSDGLGGEALRLIAPHAVGRLEFEGVFVPEEQVLGDVDQGFRVAMRTLDLFRPSVGAFAVGMAQSALDFAIRYATKRQAFGEPIASFQAVSHALAEMATRIQAARLLVHSAASAYDRGMRPAARQAAMAKLYATEAAQFVVDSAVQIIGARALEEGHPLEHLYREVRAPRIYEGTSEIQREIISRSLLRAVESEGS